MAARRSRGKPPHEPKPAYRRKVEEMVAVGDSHETIARALGITRPTLDRHYKEELKNGAAKKRAEAVTGLFRQARKGNVTALKKLEEMTRVATALEGFEKPAEESKAPKPAKRGKKEAAEADAKTAGFGSDWGDDLQVPPIDKLN